MPGPNSHESPSKYTTRPHTSLMLLALASLFAAVVATADFKYSFEDNSNDHWGSDGDKVFYKVQAWNLLASPGKPVGDTTLGTKLGHYVYASYEVGQLTDIRRLTLFCHSPTGPHCRLTFNAVIHATYELVIATFPKCSSCTEESPEESRTWTIEHINTTDPKDGWIKHSLLIGSHPVTFDIDFIATVNHTSNFVALDDIELVNCDPDSPEEEVVCPEDRFQCDGFRDCQPRDQLCDLREDCLCGEDESLPLCAEVIKNHPEGYLQLHDCDFDAFECPWYNVLSDSGKDSSFRWRVQYSPPNESLESLLHIKKTGSVEPPPDNFLQVQAAYHSAGAVAVLRSSSLQFPLTESRLCQVRFWYRNTAVNASLQLELVGVTGGSRPTTTLWRNFNTEHVVMSDSSMGDWKRVVVDLSAGHTSHSVPANYSNTYSYILQFKVTSNSTKDILSEGAVSVHSVSLSAECFHAAVLLHPCGAEGAHGPRQEQCDHYYDRKGLVTVLEHCHLAGVQEWTVPENMTYRIQAVGSRGGLGESQSSDKAAGPETRGSKVTGKFKLHQGEKLYFLIGQTPDERCQAPPGENKEGSTDLPDTQTDHSPSSERMANGGGGATVVFKLINEVKVQVLMIAGGGAGLARYSQHWPLGTASNNRRMSAVIATMSDEDAELLLNGSLAGSAPCPDSTNSSHACYGGFGAGGGACIHGGHGGGANKAQLQVRKNMIKPELDLAGRSYVNSSALYQSISSGSHRGSGFVEIFTNECGCATQCLWLDKNMTSPTCLVVRVKADRKKKDEAHSHVVLIVVAATALLAVCLIIACVCLYGQRHTLPTRHPTSVKKIASFLCPCVDLSRRAMSLSAHVLPQIQRPPAIMHVNPNYDVVIMKCPEQGLKELPRKHLKLTRALGQGAFGEVYYGLLANVPMVEGDMPVAVKTLPQMCTEQTEMDFLMEAVIVSKFNHPNIVKFIGVCFEQHPHYLVLELLEGGDLKSFLRQARPKWDQPSLLTVLDLLCLCLDISRGCQHLEERHFIHRDIAARNCLLTTKGPNRTAKIADFGMARDIYRSNYYKKAGKAMLPVKWMPPEAFLDGVFTSKTDVWSFGILMWEVFSLGHMPYPGCSNEEVMNLVTQGGRLDPPESCPSPVFDIMVSCWSALPEGRPNFSLIIASLERTLQDDDLVSKGLPVFYVPPIINTRGLRLQDNQTHNSARPKVTTSRGITSSNNSTLSPNTSGDGYLEPLLCHSFRNEIRDSMYRAEPYNFNAAVDSKVPAQTSSDFSNGRVFIEKGRPTSKPICRTPRVFYKPGSNTHQPPGQAASDALLSSHNSLTGNNTSQKEVEGLISEQKFDLCVNMNGDDINKDGCLSQDVDSEAFKLSLPVCSKSEKKSYTKFPKPPT